MWYLHPPELQLIIARRQAISSSRIVDQPVDRIATVCLRQVTLAPSNLLMNYSAVAIAVLEFKQRETTATRRARAGWAWAVENLPVSCQRFRQPDSTYGLKQADYIDLLRIAAIYQWRIHLTHLAGAQRTPVEDCRQI